jgi:hypothetical protein
MAIKNLKNGQYVRIVSVVETLKENNSYHSKIKNSVGSVMTVSASSDNLQKCILKGLDGVIYTYKDLEIVSKSEFLPKGGTFDVQNLVR